MGAEQTTLFTVHQSANEPTIQAPADEHLHGYEEWMQRHSAPYAEHVAAGIDALSSDIDPYEYRDTVDDSEAHIARIASDLNQGKTEAYQAFLEEVADNPFEEFDTRNEAALLLGDLSFFSFSPDSLDRAMEQARLSAERKNTLTCKPPGHSAQGLEH